MADCARWGHAAAAPAQIVAAVAPARNWPSAPMLSTPARKAIATASPVRMSGVARTRVAETMAYSEPSDPCQNAASACVMLADSMTINPIFWTTRPPRLAMIEVRAAVAKRPESRRAGRSLAVCASDSPQSSVSDRSARCCASCRARAGRRERVLSAALDNVYNREDHSPRRPAWPTDALASPRAPAGALRERMKCHAHGTDDRCFTQCSIRFVAGPIGPVVDTQEPHRGGGSRDAKFRSSGCLAHRVRRRSLAAGVHRGAGGQ